MSAGGRTDHNRPESDPAFPLRLAVDGVAVAGRRHPMLEPTTLSVSSGQVVLVAGEPGHGHTALSLILAGRLIPTSGSVELNGRTAGSRASGSVWRQLRRLVAVVDVPGVSDPTDVLPLLAVVGEELAMAGLPSRRTASRHWLAERDLVEYASVHMEAVPAQVRTRVLAELAAVRPGIGALVLTAPDRHGADPASWHTLARALADAGLAVVVTCTDTSAELLAEPCYPLGPPIQPPTATAALGADPACGAGVVPTTGTGESAGVTGIVGQKEHS